MENKVLLVFYINYLLINAKYYGFIALILKWIKWIEY